MAAPTALGKRPRPHDEDDDAEAAGVALSRSLAGITFENSKRLRAPSSGGGDALPATLQCAVHGVFPAELARRLSADCTAPAALGSHVTLWLDAVKGLHGDASAAAADGRAAQLGVPARLTAAVAAATGAPGETAHEVGAWAALPPRSRARRPGQPLVSDIMADEAMAEAAVPAAGKG